MNSQSTDSCTFQSASGGWTEVWRKRCREKHHEWKAGWRKRVKLGPPFQVLWCQCSCYQPRRLPLGAPAWQTTITRVKHTLEVTSLAAGIISALFGGLLSKQRGLFVIVRINSTQHEGHRSSMRRGGINRGVKRISSNTTLKKEILWDIDEHKKTLIYLGLNLLIFHF